MGCRVCGPARALEVLQNQSAQTRTSCNTGSSSPGPCSPQQEKHPTQPWPGWSGAVVLHRATSEAVTAPCCSPQGPLRVFSEAAAAGSGEPE